MSSLSNQYFLPTSTDKVYTLRNITVAILCPSIVYCLSMYMQNANWITCNPKRDVVCHTMQFKCYVLQSASCEKAMSNVHSPFERIPAHLSKEINNAFLFHLHFCFYRIWCLILLIQLTKGGHTMMKIIVFS